MPVLPVVSKETVESILKEASSDKLFLVKACEEIIKDNPEIALLISELIKINDVKTVITSVVAVYKLLKSQAEADDLKKLFIL